jgi:hypothetical protein
MTPADFIATPQTSARSERSSCLSEDEIMGRLQVLNRARSTDA